MRGTEPDERPPPIAAPHHWLRQPQKGAESGIRDREKPRSNKYTQRINASGAFEGLTQTYMTLVSHMLPQAVLTFVDKVEKERQRDFVNMQDLFAANFRPIKLQLGRSPFFVCFGKGFFCFVLCLSCGEKNIESIKV